MNHRKFFQRMIAVAIRHCSQCEEEIPEGGIYFKPKDSSVWCGSCVDYEHQKE